MRCLEDLLDDDRDDEWVFEPSVLEVLSAVVEDKVDTRHLLQCLEEASGKQSLADGSFEAVEVRGLPEGHLIAVVCFDLTEFFEKGWMRRRQTSKTAQ